MNMDFENLNQITEPLLAWYNANKRDLPWRHDPTPYRVWISEIMLQQTRVEPVIPYYLNFMTCFPTVEALAQAPEEAVLKAWEGLGYYSRARNLHKAAKTVAELGTFPTGFAGWRALPGIGEYTAGAICSIALGLPTPAVDGYVLRVLSRRLGSFEDIAAPATKKTFSLELEKIYPTGRTSNFTQALMELGAIVCLPNGAPLCDRCPLKDQCIAFRDGLLDQIPVKGEKKKRKIEEKTVFILRYRDKIALQQRPSTGLLANLWQFPNRDGHLDEAAVRNAYLPLSVKSLDSSVHVFTHIEWHMRAYELCLEHRIDGFEWLTAEEILRQKAIPSAFRTYTNYLKELRYEEI